jgi:hypothetical protein
MPRQTLTPRERMQAAIDFRPVDVVPLQVHPSPGGLYEHGQKLLDLMRAGGHDFGPLDGLQLPVVPATDFDADGRYHRVTTDAWGTAWEYRIYGIWGHRTRFPLDDLSHLDAYEFPPATRWSGAELERQRALAANHRARFYHCCGHASLFELVQNLRNYEDVLVDIATDDPAMARLMDRLVEHQQASLANGVASGADAVAVGDDFGTQQSLIFGMETWRHYFKPRYQRLLAPVVAARKKIIFHSCGAISELLPEMAALGVSAVWPQLPLFDHRELAKRCRDLGLALLLHPDRGDLLQRARPQQVRDYLLRLVDEFRILDGGAWLYLEVDPGFPWPNVEIMFRTAMEMRGM